MTTELLDVDGSPFHAPGTMVFEEPDGTLVYECPHCGFRPVPRCWVDGLRRYACKRW
jgi:DNA-directed RNA polymerase subunit RPC12/RpoP